MVSLQVWRYLIRGVLGDVVPVYFLDSDLEVNSEWDRGLTDHLYGGDQRYRICQEVLLGMGGVALLRSLGFLHLKTFHMNEGHSAFLTLALLAEEMGKTSGTGVQAAREAVRRQCVFTTHTPVPAGHDQFPAELVQQVLGDQWSKELRAECCLNHTLNMTYLALFFARHINGVAMHHGELSRTMFPNYPIDSITNGVHATTWTAGPFQKLFDHHLPEWRRDNLYLRYAIGIPLGEIQAAHAQAKKDLLATVQRRTGRQLSAATFTLGFARRAAAYKRADLFFADPERIRRLVRQAGPIQIILGGKAHPRDEAGKATIRRVFDAALALGDSLQVVYLEEYDMELGKLLTAGVDVWLNTPHKPEEASGTSGMKASLNGVPSLSILDGWWVEGHCEGVTGWAIGEDENTPSDALKEMTSLYDKLHFLRLS
jgi:starch phosphorylase